MGWSGGTYTATDGTYTSTWAANWAGDADDEIKTGEFDLLIADIEGGIDSSLNKDGSNAWTGDLDAGSSYHITNLAAGSATGDSSRWDEAVASLGLTGTTLEVNLNDGTQLTQDLAAVGTAGEVTLSGTQTLTGQKQFSALTELAHIKNNGPITQSYQNVASSTTPTFDTTASAAHIITVSQNQTWTFTWPTGASDAELGDYWGVKGVVMAIINGAYTISLDGTMTSALTDYEEEGSAPSASSRIATLTYHYVYRNGSDYCQFAWIATA